MQKYDAIESGIANNDIKALREAIGSICYTNRDFSNGEFFEVVKYVESKGIKLKDDKLQGNPTISSLKSEFNDEDFARAVFELKKNFCDERIRDVEAIGKKLYGKSVVQTTRPESVKSKESVKEGRQAPQRLDSGTLPNLQSHRSENTKQIVIGAVAIVAVVVIAYIILSKI